MLGWGMQLSKTQVVLYRLTQTNLHIWRCAEVRVPILELQHQGTLVVAGKPFKLQYAQAIVHSPLPVLCEVTLVIVNIW